MLTYNFAVADVSFMQERTPHEPGLQDENGRAETENELWAAAWGAAPLFQVAQAGTCHHSGLAHHFLREGCCLNGPYLCPPLLEMERTSEGAPPRGGCEVPNAPSKKNPIFLEPLAP